MIDKSAFVENGAIIADGVTIGAFCYVSKGVTLSKGVILEPHSQIDGDTFIGENTHIYPHARLGSSQSKLVIGKDTHIREFTRIGTEENSDDINIGDDCYIMGHCQIKGGTSLKNSVTLTNSTTVGVNCRLDDKVIVGGMGYISDNTSIGICAMIGGASKVVSNIPPFALVAGYPEAKIKGLNLIGMRRNFTDKKSIAFVKNAFVKLKRDNYNQNLARDMLRDNTDKQTKIFLDFVSTNKIK